MADHSGIPQIIFTRNYWGEAEKKQNDNPQDNPQYNKLKMQWDSSPEIRSEFFDFENYLAYSAPGDGVKLRSTGRL